jgi:hypothetical protein
MLGMLAVLTLLPPGGMLTSGMLSLRLSGGMLTLLHPACLLLLPTLSSALPEIIKIGQAVSIISKFISVNISVLNKQHHYQLLYTSLDLQYRGYNASRMYWGFVTMHW